MAVVAAIALALELRLFRLIDKNAVNLLFGDQWDFMTSFFERQPLWRLYVQQYGPHREGLGFVLDKFVFDFTHWNSRAEAFFIFAIMSLAMAAAVWLKHRLFGSITAWDAVIPCLFLTAGQYEIFTGAISPAPQSFPILLLVLYCIAWLHTHLWARYGLVLGMNFLLLYSGYGLFVGLLTPVFLGLEWLRERRSDRSGGSAALALLISLASLGSFFVGYKFGYRSVCAVEAHGIAPRMRYVGLMFANFLRIKGTGVVPSLAGLLLLAGAAGIFLGSLRNLMKTEEDSTRRVIAILFGYSLVVATAAAVGRLCLGMQYAQSSRYVTYLIPAFLGFYFRILQMERPQARKIVLGLMMISTGIPAIWLSRSDKGTLRWLSSGKQAWRACYLQSEDIARCDAVSRFPVYPNPEAVHLKEKLEYLKRNQLNLYSDVSAANDENGHVK